MSYLIVRFLYLFGSHTSTNRVFLSLHDFHRKFFYILLILLLGPITGLFFAQCFHRHYLVRVLVINVHTQFGTLLIIGSLLLYIFYCIIKYVHSLVHGQDQTTVLQSILWSTLRKCVPITDCRIVTIHLHVLRYICRNYGQHSPCNIFPKVKFSL